MSMNTQSGKREESIEYGVDGVTLLRYVYKTEQPASEVPKPFIHPLRTLGGNIVSIYRPNDHRWHTGVMMTMSHLGDKNFWGGPSYVRDQGYQRRGNHGRIDHLGFSAIQSEGDKFAIDEALQWKVEDGTVWLEETRRIAVEKILREENYWWLSYSMKLHNVSGEPLDFGSPTTHGRSMAGYGSLFWRGPRSFTNGTVIGPEEHEDYMGVQMPWIAYQGTHDGVDDQSTLLFVDEPRNPRFPNKWFVRKEPYACVSFSFMFDETYRLEPDADLSLRYHILIFDGAPDKETLARVAAFY